MTVVLIILGGIVLIGLSVLGYWFYQSRKILKDLYNDEFYD